MSEDVEGISQCRNRVSRVLERLVAGRSSIALEQIVFHQLTEDVSDRNVHSWMRAVFAEGTVTETSDAFARRPPSLPERPMVLRFWFAACFIAASTFAELPLVLMPMATETRGLFIYSQCLTSLERLRFTISQVHACTPSKFAERFLVNSADAPHHGVRGKPLHDPRLTGLSQAGSQFRV
jgi:hypothetical protein